MFEMGVQIFENGTPLSTMVDSALANSDENQTSSSNLLSVMSMNLLAPLYVRPIDKRTGLIQDFAKFDWVKEDSILHWETRKLRLLNCLTSCQAHIICLQELQLERFNEEGLKIPTWLAPIANDFGYKAFLPEQEYLEKIAARNVRVLGADAAVTCAILVKTSKDWDIVELSGTTSKDSTNYVSVCLQHSTNESMDPLVVTSVHLDAKSEKKRIHQLAKCFGRARNLLDFASSKKTIAPLTAILAGDMNAEFVRGSCMSAILQDYDNDRPTKAQMQQACTEALRLVDESTPTDKQMKEWKQLQSEAQVVVQDHCLSLNRVDTGATRAAYSHDGLKNMEIWKLDHILYSSDCLTPVNKWSTLECDEVSCAMGLPNHTCPSDHLPIASVFDIRPANPLGASKRESALNRFDQLVKAQKKTLDDLKNEMETKKQVIMKQLAPSATIGSQQSESSVEPLSKKARRKKQKKEPPPKEIIAVVREARGRIKQLKNDQVSERDQLVQQFNNLERLLIQEKSGMKWREWIIKA